MDFIALQTALAGQYFLERELGRGGMGVVYLAREVRLDRPVAVKVLPPALAARPELRERFLREARTAAKLAHPNIVPIYRVDEAGEFVYLVMGYVDGGSVGDRLRERGTLPAPQVVRLVREVGWALAYAHARGVVHRDVKPDNILLDRETGRALVTDFGIAQVAGAEGAAITGEGHVMGTAHYMSPEQAAGEPLDGRSDLYALGVVAYQALAGHPPFDAPTVAALLAKHLTLAPPPLPAAGVPARLGQVVLACLAKTPDERPATGETLADLLDAVESERTLPPPLRAFAEARDPLLALYAVWAAGFTVSAAARVALYVNGVIPNDRFAPARFVLEAAIIISLPVLAIVAFQLRHAWRALASGYGVEDLRTALRRDAERVAAESAELEILPPRLAQGYRIVTYGAIAGMAAVIFSAPFGRDWIERTIPSWAMATYFLGTVLLGVVGSALGLTWPGRPSSSGLIDRLRRRFWASRAGEMAAAGLMRLVRRRRAAAYVPRATELAIGHAADALLAALPAPVRAGLGELPPLVRHLEREAEAMRAREGELSARLSTVHAGPAELRGPAHDALAAELREARDAAARRREAALGALETIRLDLLRLQAGIGEPGSLTAIVEKARRLGSDVDALLAGRQAVETDWRMPSPPEGRRAGV